jgi:hypothetical protein
MESGLLYDSLREMFVQQVISLREPQFLRLPFSISIMAMETNLLIKESIFTLLGTRIDVRAYDAIMSAIEDCRNLGAIYADRCELLHTTPLQVIPSETSPIMFYGELERDSCLLLLNAFNAPRHAKDMETHPLVRTINAARDNHWNVAKIISIFDADRDHALRKHLAEMSGTPIAYESIYDMREVFRMLLSAPEDFGLEKSAIEKAKHHYERNPTIVPPSIKK